MTALSLRGDVATVRERLRAATSEAHRRLDHHALLAAVLDGSGGLAPYRRMLQAYAPLYARIDAAIATAMTLLPAGFDWRGRLKSDWLRADLEVLGAAAMPQSYLPAVPQPLTTASVIGLLYPIEGSTLGARMIATRLRQLHGLDEATGARFLAGYGADTKRRWDESCAFFETIAGDAPAIEEAIAVARAVFACFETTLDAAQRC